MLRRRRRDQGRNPAWPGLVDVFVFTLVFVMLVGLGDDSGKTIEKLEQEKKQLQLENERLKKENAKLREIVGGRGLRELKEFYETIKNNMPENYKINFDEDAIEILITGVPPIYVLIRVNINCIPKTHNV